jgi:NADH dehydrogenase (ubiquinone) 1 beta subcomplex subunit 9
MPSLMEHERYLGRLYKQMLKLSFDWSLEHWRYRSLCVAIRRQFDQHLAQQRQMESPVEQARFVLQMHHLLNYYQHPEPYQYPVSPRGVAWEREERLPLDIIENGWGKGKLQTLCGRWDYMIPHVVEQERHPKDEDSKFV